MHFTRTRARSHLGHSSDRGASSVEYSLIVALIAVVIIVVVGFVGQDVLELFEKVDF